MKNQIEFVIPKGYIQSDKSTDEKLVFELIEKKDIEKEKRDFLFGIFNRMKVRVDPNKPGRVYYDVDGMGTVFEQDFNNGYLWVSHTHIWTIFFNRFLMNSEIQSFIKTMTEEILNWRGLTPHCVICTHLFGVEEPLNWRGLTP